MNYIAKEEIERMLAKVCTKDPMGVRDRALVITMAHTGLRVSELSLLDVADVIASNGEVRTTLYVRPEVGKLGRARQIPLNSIVRAELGGLVSWNKSRGFSVAMHAPIFVTKAHRRITPRAIQYVVKDLREKAGLDVPATPHSLRANFLSAITATSNVRVAQLIAGHARLNTLAYYTFPSPEEMAQAAERVAQMEVRP